MPTTRQLSDYKRFRQWQHPEHALNSVRTLTEFRKHENDDDKSVMWSQSLRDYVIQIGAVRITAEYEQESYFDVYGEPEGYTNASGNHVSPETEREDIERLIDQWGLFTVSSQIFTGDYWETVDSVGMCLYQNPTDPFNNGYVVDLMSAALAERIKLLSTDVLCPSTI